MNGPDTPQTPSHLTDSDFELDDVEPDTKKLATKGLRAVQQAFMRRLEREAVGAYMAGYDALDVLRPNEPFVDSGPDDANPVAMRASFVPREHEDATPLAIDGFETERYVLTDLTAADADAARDRWGNDHD